MDRAPKLWRQHDRSKVDPLRLVAFDRMVDMGDDVPDEVLSTLVQDLVATLGWSQTEAESFVRRHPGGRYPRGGPPRVLVVVDEVQQAVHDDRIDVTWPACPLHPNHPLQLRDDLPAVWTCPSTHATVCALGELPGRA